MLEKQNSTRPRRVPNTRMIQNFHLVWLDGNIDEENDEDCRNTITKLRQIVNTINTFTDMDECIDFVDNIKDEKAFIISSGAFAQTIIPVVHDKPQINTIYIFCENKTRYEKWVKGRPKTKGVFTDITPICEALKQAASDCDQNSVSISFVQATDKSSNQNLDTLDKSFMYTQILKEILLSIDFEQTHVNEFLTYARKELDGNTIELQNIDKIALEYHHHLPVWWYTYQSFLYSMLNRALRLMEVDLIVKMGFFVRDLHNHIVELHSKQFRGSDSSDIFIVYRGQGLSQADFDQLFNTQGELLSFNNFLSTSKDPDVSLRFALRTISTSDLIGVLFIITIDPSIKATPFANVKDVGYYNREEEILFSMHSVFRIGQVKQLDQNTRLWQVELTLTSDNDPQLHALTKTMRQETSSNYKGWHRLGQLMIELGHFNKAEELYDILLKQTNDKREKSIIFHQLGRVKNDQGKYADALESYKKSTKTFQRIFSFADPDLAAYYGGIGSVYDNMGEYSKALLSYEKALKIMQKTLPMNHPHLTTSYNNIGGVYKDMGEYSKALSYYEKALEISQKTLPANHPSLATSYNNIGLVHKIMGEYSEALSYYEKDLEISQKTLPANHPSLATSYNNIGGVYKEMGEYSKALLYYEKALEIKQNTLFENHPSLATSYNNIGLVYDNMNEYSKALSYLKRALDIGQHSLPLNHPDLKSYRQSIEIVEKKL